MRTIRYRHTYKGMTKTPRDGRKACLQIKDTSGDEGDILLFRAEV